MNRCFYQIAVFLLIEAFNKLLLTNYYSQAHRCCFQQIIIVNRIVVFSKSQIFYVLGAFKKLLYESSSLFLSNRRLFFY